jgi:hypothetical protein
LDIYATSIDYDSKTETSKELFIALQNKMHWAAHGHTAAEIIYNRVNSKKNNMGLTSWSGKKLKKSDVEIAKNYLNAKELDTLNRIVSAYLDFAELQALNQKPMYMSDWIDKLNEFLKLSERNILSHLGKVSHEKALNKAKKEYIEYRKLNIIPSPVEKHFLTSIKEIQKIDSNK